MLSYYLTKLIAQNDVDTSSNIRLPALSTTKGATRLAINLVAPIIIVARSGLK